MENSLELIGLSWRNLESTKWYLLYSEGRLDVQKLCHFCSFYISAKEESDFFVKFYNSDRFDGAPLLLSLHSPLPSRFQG
jgi:hypothetical protein